MPVIRGFVQKIDVGRAGLVQVTLVHEDATSGVYIIRDLDADPERFNERLSKLGVLRDAMNRAEPVEIEHHKGEGGEEIDRAVRITRDDLAPPQQTEVVTGLVVQVSVGASQGIQAGSAERPDEAAVVLFTAATGLKSFVLNLQIPERPVAQQQLRILLDAEEKTRAVVLQVDPKNAGASRILSVAAVDANFLAGSDTGQDLNGFVESLSLIRVSTIVMTATFAHVRFTTAPPFTGPGNIVSKSPFTPMTMDLLVPKNSLVYELFEAGLRDNLRMRVLAEGLVTRTGDQKANAETNVNFPVRLTTGLNLATLANISAAAAGETPMLYLALAAELLAPLASASRPVWINIERESLDRGPECGCAEGTPSSDLNAKTLRDLRIPYLAVWKGLGCFNRGVYRIQIEADTVITLALDGVKLCVHDSDNPKVKFAYVCLCGDHELEIKLADWTCDKEFNLDVYRLR